MPLGSLGWRRTYTSLFVSLACLIAIYWSTAASMVNLWFRAPFSHGFLVLPLAAAIAWTRRDQLDHFDAAPTFWALPMLALLTVVWLLGDRTTTDVVKHWSLVAMMIVIIWCHLGHAIARRLLLPLSFLFFAVPMGEPLVPAMQRLTAKLAVALLHASSVPVLLEGNTISVPGHIWQVANACSGISYLFASIAIGYLYAGLMYHSWTRRVAVVAASIVVPLVANGLRVYTVILIAAVGASGIAFGIEHYLYGWMFFAIIMALFFWMAGLWAETQGVDSSAQWQPTWRADRRPSLVRTLSIACLPIATVAVAPLSAAIVWQDTAFAFSTNLKPLQVTLPWRAAPRDAFQWQPRFISPTAEFLQTYDAGTHSVKAYVAYYAAGQRRVKLASVANELFDDSWLLVGESETPVTVDGQSFVAHETLLRSPASALTVWSWYWVDGRDTSSDYLAKLLFAKARIFPNGGNAAAIAVAAEGTSIESNLEGTLRDFLRHASFSSSFPEGNTRGLVESASVATR